MPAQSDTTTIQQCSSSSSAARHPEGTTQGLAPSSRHASSLHCHEVELGQRTISGIFVGRVLK